MNAEGLPYCSTFSLAQSRRFLGQHNVLLYQCRSSCSTTLSSISIQVLLHNSCAITFQTSSLSRSPLLILGFSPIKCCFALGGKWFLMIQNWWPNDLPTILTSAPVGRYLCAFDVADMACSVHNSSFISVNGPPSTTASPQGHTDINGSSPFKPIPYRQQVSKLPLSSEPILLRLQSHQ